MSNEKNRVCPVELAGSLDSKIRKWLQNPQKILSPYIEGGDEGSRHWLWSRVLFG